MEHAPCCVVLCKNPAAGHSPQSRLLLCRSHLQREVKKVRSLHKTLSQSLSPAAYSLKWMQQLHQRLEADELELREIFQSLEDRMHGWREGAITRIQSRVAIMEMQMEALKNADFFLEEAAAAATADDWHRVFRLVLQVESSVEFLEDCNQPLAKLKEEHSISCLEDVRNGWDIAQSSITSFLTEFNSTDPKVHQIVQQIPTGKVWRTAICHNTAGFAFHRARSLVAKIGGEGFDGTDGWEPLPKICLIFSFHGDERKHHLMLESLDQHEAVSIQLKPSIRWDLQIHALRCDSERQQLLIAQGRGGITITDLAGTVLRSLTPQLLAIEDMRITGLCFNSKRIFALNYNAQTILAISRDTGKVERTLDASKHYETKHFTESLVWQLDHLLMTDWTGRKVHRISATTGNELASYPSQTSPADSIFKGPYDIATDNQGRLYVADIPGHAVHVMDTNGKIVGTFGGSEGAGGHELAAPVALEVVEDWNGTGVTWLLVADNEKERVCTFCVKF